MNYSTVKYRIIVCKKKISQIFPNYRFKNNYFDAFYRWKRTHAKILRFKWRFERKIEGRGGGEIRRRVFLANTWNTSREGKLWGQISFDISKCLEAVFPSATISTCMPWCHGILRYTREWVLLRFPSLQCRWFPPPLAILGAPQIHLTSYLTLGWKKIKKVSIFLRHVIPGAPQIHSHLHIFVLSFLYYLENYLFEIDIFVSFMFHFPSVWKILIS